MNEESIYRSDEQGEEFSFGDFTTGHDPTRFASQPEQRTALTGGVERRAIPHLKANRLE